MEKEKGKKKEEEVRISFVLYYVWSFLKGFSQHQPFRIAPSARHREKRQDFR